MFSQYILKHSRRLAELEKCLYRSNGVRATIYQQDLLLSSFHYRVNENGQTPDKRLTLFQYCPNIFPIDEPDQKVFCFRYCLSCSRLTLDVESSENWLFHLAYTKEYRVYHNVEETKRKACFVYILHVRARRKTTRCDPRIIIGRKQADYVLWNYTFAGLSISQVYSVFSGPILCSSESFISISGF